MIITASEAKYLTRDALAGKATGFCEILSSYLGLERHSTVTSSGVVFSKEDALTAFSSAYKTYPRDSRSIREFAHSQRQCLNRLIDDRTAFRFNDVAYIPLRQLSQDYRQLLYDIAGKPRPKGLVDRIFPFRQGKLPFVELYGLGAEMGHFLCDTFYPNKTDCGADEAMDVLAQALESVLDIQYLYSQSGVPVPDQRDIKSTVISRSADATLGDIGCFERLLLEGNDDLCQEVSKCIPGKDPEKGLTQFRSDYARTRHYEGFKIFQQLYSRAGGDFDACFKLYGSLMADSSVVTTADTLRYLGYPGGEIVKLSRFFDGDYLERFGRLPALK